MRLGLDKVSLTLQENLRGFPQAEVPYNKCVDVVDSGRSIYNNQAGGGVAKSPPLSLGQLQALVPVHFTI